MFNPWLRKTPWRRKWQSTPVFFPGEFHEQRSLECSRPGGHKELDTTEQLLLTQTWSQVQNNVRHFTSAQQVIVELSRSHLINAF